MELWDLYDATRRPLHQTHPRSDETPAGTYHIVVEIWTIDDDGNVLLTLRDPNKETYPNKWENTGGSALSGETSRRAAVRELREETGIIASEDALVLLGTYRTSSAFVDIYLLRRSIPVAQLTLQPGETIDAKWVSLAELDELIQDQSIALPVGTRLEAIREAFDEQLGKRIGGSAMRQPQNVHVYLYRKNGGDQFEYAIFQRADDAKCWQGISGGVEEGETIEQAAAREAFEEGGVPANTPLYRLDTVSYLPADTFAAHRQWGKDVVVCPMLFFAMPFTGDIRLSGEHLNVMWHTYQPAYDLVYWHDQKTALWELNQRLLRNNLLR